MREYKRGHKKQALQQREPNPTLPDYPDYTQDNGDLWQSISMDDATAATPDDPDPADQESDEKPRPQIVRITKGVRNDIQGKVEMMLTFIEFGWAAKDPVCAPVLGANSEKIAEKFTNIIVRNPDMVKWFTKGGGYMDWFDLLMALLPVIKVAVSHHLTKSIETPGQTEPNYSQYTAA